MDESGSAMLCRSTHSITVQPKCQNPDRQTVRRAGQPAFSARLKTPQDFQPPYRESQLYADRRAD